MHNLNELIPADSGWLLTTARSINEKGQITGLGLLNGEFHAFVLTPTSSQEPPAAHAATTPTTAAAPPTAFSTRRITRKDLDSLLG
jgi:hypothetical protein